MSKKPKPAGKPHQPSIDNPGELPVDDKAKQTAAEKNAEREDSEVFSTLRRVCGSGAFITLRRSHPPTGQFKPGFIGQMSIDQFTEENVKLLYGGGDFEVQGKNAAGQIVHSGKFTIDHTIKPKNPGSEKEPERREPGVDLPGLINAVVAAIPKPVPPDNSALAEAMKQNTAIVTAALARPESNSSMQMFEKLAAMQMQMAKELREAQERDRQEARQAQEKSEARFMKALEAMATNKEAPKSFLEQLQEFKAMQEMIGEGGKDEDEGWAKEIGKGIASVAVPIIKEHFTGGGQAAGGASLTRPALPLPRRSPPVSTARPATGPIVEGTITEPVATDPAAPAPRGETAAAGDAAAPLQPADDMTIAMRIKLTMLRNSAMAAAAKGRDPEEWLADKLEGVSDEDQKQIFEPANKNTWFETFFAEHPDANKHLEFLREVRMGVLDRAFVAHVKLFAASDVPATQTVEQFLGWVTKDYHDFLLGLTETEGDDAAWPVTFAEVTTVNPEWLEQVRLAIIAQLDPEAGKVVEMEKPAPPPPAAKGPKAKTK